MRGIRRREFLQSAASAAAAAWLAPKSLAVELARLPRLDRKFAATETVTIGQTGIRTSLLAMGTGTVGSGHHSNQTALGLEGLSRLLQNGYDNGLRFFDTADSYGSHPHVADALKHVDRSKVTVMTKSWARTAPEMRADLDRFRRELNTDYLDICLMHCVTEADWATRFQPAMDVLSEAKQKGVIRRNGLFLPFHRSAAGCGEISVGASGSGSHEPHRFAHGCRSRSRRGRDSPDARRARELWA